MANGTDSTLSMSLPQALRYHFFTKKMNTPVGYVTIALLGILVGFLAALDSKAAIILVGAFVAILTVLVILRYPLFGFYITQAFSLIIPLPQRALNQSIPLGLVVEALTYLTWIAAMAQQYRNRETTANLWNKPNSIIFLILIGYYILEAFNPLMHSTLGWFAYFRKQVSFLVLYYTAHILLNSYDKLKFFIKFSVLMAFVTALYGIKQHWIGFFQFEKTWIYINPHRAILFFQGGVMRKFSFLSDPASYGVYMASMAVFMIIMGLRTVNKKAQRIYLVLGFLTFMASGYSGTRTSTMMIIAGICMYALFTLNEKRTGQFIMGSILFGLFIFFGPFRNNPVVLRMKSTFNGSQDASARLRDQNRAAVQPYMHTHPIGGGIFTVGMDGDVYNPGHYLAPVQPDSGYVKTVLEQGYIGFLLMLASYFVAMRVGIRNFYRARSPEIKNIYIALTICLFTLYVGQFSQIAISQYPQILFYYASLIVLNKLIDYDTPNSETT